MRLPICYICGNRKDPGMRLLSFKLSDQEKIINEKFSRLDIVGHPPGKEWFCKKHADIMQDLTDFTLKDALEIFNKQSKK